MVPSASETWSRRAAINAFAIAICILVSIRSVDPRRSFVVANQRVMDIFFLGDYCEVEIEQSCPVSWWGHPVCGPCNCAVEYGYNAHCNKTTGECYCKV